MLTVLTEHFTSHKDP